MASDASDTRGSELGEVHELEISIVPVKDERGGMVYLVPAARDITGRRRGEERLRESEYRWRSIFQNSAISLWEEDISEVRCLFRALREQGVTDLAGHLAAHPNVVNEAMRSIRVVAVNDATLRLYEAQSPEQLLGSLDVTLDAEASPSFVDALMAIAEGKGHDERESTAVTLKGRRIEVMIRSFIPAETDPRTNMLVSVIDLTEKKRAEREARRLEEQLAQARKLESVGRLAGGVAHDFNNLLTCIMGNLSLAVGELASEDPLRDTLAEALRAAESAADVTRRLLSFSRRQVVEPRALDLNTLIVDMKRMLGRIIGERIELRTRLAEGLGPVCVDPSQVEQIIVNLVVNARDAMPGGGVVEILTREEEGDVVLEVGDSGHGMSEEVKTHLFEPFFTTKPVGQGTGLGLAMVYGAVRQHDGRVEVDTEPGRGTRFRIYLPACALREDPAARVPESVPPTGREAVLLVEDEPLVRSYAVRLLRKLGYEVTACGDGEEAVRAWRSQDGRFDLLMTDVVMPGVGGIELAQALRLERPELAVLYTSGYAEVEEFRQTAASRRTAFLAKPYGLEDLSLTLRRILEPAGAAA